jgi:hypothetical protein
MIVVISMPIFYCGQDWLPCVFKNLLGADEVHLNRPTDPDLVCNAGIVRRFVVFLFFFFFFFQSVSSCLVIFIDLVQFLGASFG